MGKFQIYKDRRGEYRWRFRASNGRILGDSGEGYVAKTDCRRGIDVVKRDARGADVEDET